MTANQTLELLDDFLDGFLRSSCSSRYQNTPKPYLVQSCWWSRWFFFRDHNTASRKIWSFYKFNMEIVSTVHRQSSWNLWSSWYDMIWRKVWLWISSGLTDQTSRSRETYLLLFRSKITSPTTTATCPTRCRGWGGTCWHFMATGRFHCLWNWNILIIR